MKTDDSVFEQCATELGQKHYAVIDDFLSSQQVTDIVASLENKFARHKFKKAGVGQDPERQLASEIRGDFIYWLDPEKDFEIKRHLVPSLGDFMACLRRHCFLPVKDYEMHYSVYPKGAHYRRHLDQFKNDDSRVITFLVYLNFDWKKEHGGALRLYLEGGKHLDIVPEAGRFVCFRSDLLEHEVLPTNRKRYAISGWMLSRKSALKFLK